MEGGLEVREEEVVIVGAGIAGLATAVALKRVGVRCLVLERSERLRTTGAALSLFPNAWLALDALGVAHKLTPRYPPLLKMFLTDIGTGAVQEISHAAGGTGIRAGPRTVHRKVLLETLAEELPANTIRFSSKLSSIQTQPGEGGSLLPILHLQDGTVIKAKVLIGCDGVHSMVARWLGLSAPVHSGRSAARGLAHFPEPHGLEHAIYQFLDSEKRAGFVPLSDKDFYWFLTCKSTAEEDAKFSGNPELLQREIIENFAKDFPSAYLDVVRHADVSELTWAPLVFRYPWNVISGNVCQGTITVAGDAMHPMTPDRGQGGCTALEDAVVLGRHIGESFIRNNGQILPQETAEALKRYFKERRWHTASVIATSYLSGWAQQSGSTWWMKLIRDVIFYRFLFPILFNMQYDCGRLPDVSTDELLKNQKKGD
ncbi:monooxygenase 2-like [Malania oleifera]|uniref:monooxygenase 2-like n=1 Tax=Malania oleifera TaxID=397392 RepID=UPI0025AEAD4E|nr:monooxygenase 2-like [Malania oleifera]